MDVGRLPSGGDVKAPAEGSGPTFVTSHSRWTQTDPSCRLPVAGCRIPEAQCCPGVEWEKADGDARGPGMSCFNMKTFIAFGSWLASSQPRSPPTGGARKVSWILKRDGRETVVAMDRFDFTVEAGRFTGDGKATLHFKAVHADTIKTRHIAITLREAIADPQFTLKAPRHWDGRKPIEVVPQISNLDRLKAVGAAELQTVWKVGDLAAAWKRDYPNVQHYHVFQIWPLSCSMGIDGSDNRLREVQRNLPTAFSNLSVLSTLGVEPPGGCHFPAAGYAEFARMLFPLIERDHYGKTFPGPIEPPNLRRASFARSDRTRINLAFDQPVVWTNTLAGEFLIDGVRGKVLGGSVSGNLLTLKLAGPSAGRTITYLDSSKWSQARLLKGANDLAALTFCEVTIGKP